MMNRRVFGCALAFGPVVTLLGQVTGAPLRIADEPIAPPQHPPIHLIAPMPMPSGDANDDASGRRTVKLHNSETGRTYELPLGEGDPERLVEDDGYKGFDGGSDFSTRGWGSMSIVDDINAYPARMNCKLVMRFVDANGQDVFYVCSGSMGDPGVVVTAGHCLYAHGPDGNDIFDWAREVWVYPAWDGGTPAGNPPTPDGDSVVQRFGWARGTEYLAGSEWVDDEDSTRDAGLVRLNRLNTRQPGLITGWYGSTSAACDPLRTYRNFSYPAASCDVGAGLHNGRDMYYWDGIPDLCSLSYIKVYIGSGCFNSFWGGMSGSGVYYIDDGVERVNAVLTHHTTSGIETGRSTRLWNQFVEDMQSFEKDTRGSDADFQALWYRATGSHSIVAGSSLDEGTVQVSNVGRADPPSTSFQMRLYLSTNNNISEADTLLRSWNYFADFDAVSNISFDVPAAQIPLATPPGDYWVGVVIDQSEDANFSNNDTDTWDAQRITVLACPALQPPGNVKATDGVSCNEIEVTWSAVPAAMQYLIFRNTADDFDGAVQIGLSTGLSFTDDGVYSGIGYWYWVRAQGSCGISAPSDSNRGYIQGTENNLCVRATPMLGYAGSTSGDLTCATQDGDTSCDGTLQSTDAWHLFLGLSPGVLVVTTCGTHDDPGVDLGMDTILSVHSECPGGVSNQLVCNDDNGGFLPCFGDGGVKRDSIVEVQVAALKPVLIRVGFSRGQIRDGRYKLNWVFTPTCAADVNEDGFVTGEDFDEFVHMFELGAPGADYNGDGFVNGDDFDAFVADYEQGC